MNVGLKIFLTTAGLYGGVRLAVLAVQWMKEGFDKLSPRKHRDYRDY